MCNLETEGTKYGCGHYKVVSTAHRKCEPVVTVVKTRKVRKIDCASPYCVHSIRHPRNCSDCQCERYLGPDSKETITLTTPEYCASCKYWFKDGAQHRRAAT